MKEAVKDLDGIGRLEAAIQVIEQGLESEERSQEMSAKVLRSCDNTLLYIPPQRRGHGSISL